MFAYPAVVSPGRSVHLTPDREELQTKHEASRLTWYRLSSLPWEQCCPPHCGCLRSLSCDWVGGQCQGLRTPPWREPWTARIWWCWTWRRENCPTDSRTSSAGQSICGQQTIISGHQIIFLITWRQHSQHTGQLRRSWICRKTHRGPCGIPAFLSVLIAIIHVAISGH